MAAATFAPGPVMANHPWLVDAQVGDVVVATAIDGGEPEPKEDFILFENIRPGNLKPSSPASVGHASLRELLLRACRPSSVHDSTLFRSLLRHPGSLLKQVRTLIVSKRPPSRRVRAGCADG
jgi:hypothetical protein